MHKRTIKKYEKILLAFLESEAKYTPKGEVKNIVVADKVNRNYQLIYYGWEVNHTFSYQVLIHFQITEDAKVLLLVNKTDIPLDIELLKMGIALTDFVPLFIEPQYREKLGYGNLT